MVGHDPQAHVVGVGVGRVVLGLRAVTTAELKCAVCVLCGLGARRAADAVTAIEGTPVCRDHASLLAGERVLTAAKVAREDLR